MWLHLCRESEEGPCVAVSDREMVEPDFTCGDQSQREINTGGVSLEGPAMGHERCWRLGLGTGTVEHSIWKQNWPHGQGEIKVVSRGIPRFLCVLRTLS